MLCYAGVSCCARATTAWSSVAAPSYTRKLLLLASNRMHVVKRCPDADPYNPQCNAPRRSRFPSCQAAFLHRSVHGVTVYAIVYPSFRTVHGVTVYAKVYPSFRTVHGVTVYAKLYPSFRTVHGVTVYATLYPSLESRLHHNMHCDSFWRCYWCVRPFPLFLFCSSCTKCRTMALK
jgi:hypothetical protein